MARIPFIAINTIERGRTLDMLKEVADELSLQDCVHTLSKGIYDLATEKVLNEDKSVYGAIDFMGEQMKKREFMTFVLTETPDLSGDNSETRQILDLVTLAEESGGVVIVLTSNSVWNQLQRLGMTVKVDLLNEDEMYLIIKEDVVKNEYPDAGLSSFLGLVSICRLGVPYEVYILDFRGGILVHYKSGQVLPGGLEKARAIAMYGGYAFIEVYTDCCRAVAGDGEVSVIPDNK